MAFETKADENSVFLWFPPTDALDALLSTSAWTLKKATEWQHLLSRDVDDTVEISSPLPADKIAIAIDSADKQTSRYSKFSLSTLE